MRLFIAAELSEELIAALAETSALLRGQIHGRYVSADLFHVTLAFLGNVEGHRVNRVIDALEEGCSGFESCEVTLGALGSFGRRSKAVLWQGFSNAGNLAEIAQAVRAALLTHQFAFDEKTFRAHVTLMRGANVVQGNLPSPVIASGTIDAITLFRSDLSGKHPVYEPLHSIWLS